MHELVIEEFKRRVFDESMHRIVRCLKLLSDDQIWHQPSPNTNSIGNLVIHLLGNAEQWIIGSFGQRKITRNRPSEFLPHQNLPQSILLNKIQALKTEMSVAIERLTADQLIQRYDVQVFQETGISILIHVIEHFSYHTGQIAFQTKLLADQSLDFYAMPLE